MTQVLLVEDDVDISVNLSRFLQGEGFEITAAGGQKEAIEKISAETDIVLLDISLPDGNGFSVCREIKENFNVPVIFLTASGDEYSVVAGLEMGADDYISKPFRPRELVSRIKTVLRRYSKGGQLFEIGDLRVDAEKAVVTKNGKTVFLSALEYRLLMIFLNNRGVTLTRSHLLQEIWDVAGDYVNDNTLTVYIKRLREKTETDPQNPVIIKTVRGLGYKVD